MLICKLEQRGCPPTPHRIARPATASPIPNNHGQQNIAGFPGIQGRDQAPRRISSIIMFGFRCS